MGCCQARHPADVRGRAQGPVEAQGQAQQPEAEDINVQARHPADPQQPEVEDISIQAQHPAEVRDQVPNELAESQPISSIATGEGKYLGICSAGGKVFAAPWNADALLVYDPVAKQLESVDITAHARGHRKFVSVCQAGGKVCAVPLDADRLLVYDPATRHIEGVDITALAVGKSKFWGACQAGGKLFAAPDNANQLLIYDPATKRVEGVDVTALGRTQGKFFGICQAGGKIYAAPFNAEKLLIYDPSTRQLEGKDVSAVATGVGKFGSICQAGGKIFAAPFNADKLLVFHPSSGLLEGVDVTAHATGPGKFRGICQAGGQIFAAPRNADKLLVYDPDAKRLDGLPFTTRATTHRFRGICQAGGRVFVAPRHDDTLLICDPATKQLQQLDVRALATGRFKFGEICEVGGRVCAAPYNADRLLVYNRPDDFKEVEPHDLEIEPTPFDHGQFGEVFRARLLGLFDVVVKKPRCGTLNERDARAFLEEARIMGLVRHPHCVKLLAVCRKPDSLMLVTEWMERGSLYAVLGQQHLQPSVDERLLWARHASQALSFLHCRIPRVIHGDIKSLNMLIDRSSMLKLSDFGMARIQSFTSTLAGGAAGAVTQAAGGTADWMAPELFDHGGNSRASDVYSLGVVLYELAFDHTPYRGLALNQAVNVIRMGVRPGATDLHEGQPDRGQRRLPLGFFEVLCGAWCREAGDRPTADAMSDKIAGLLAEITGGLASGHADGFDGDDGEPGVVSPVGEVGKWQLISGVCKERCMHFRGVWRPEVQEWFPLWSRGVSTLHTSGRCSRMLVVTYDEARNGTKFGANMLAHELPFLEQNGIPYEAITFTDFMRTYGRWN